MKKLSRSLLGVSLAAACSCLAAAQENSQGNISAPPVLQITREYTKPGKSGMVHEKAESAFVQAMTRAKWPTHYLAVTSLSGKSCALFLTYYPSFEAWEKDNAAVEKNPTLSAALDRATMADGELLDSADQGVFVFREDLSLRPMLDVSQMRYLEVLVYHVRPGYSREWTVLAKMVRAGYEKGVPGAHWGMYQLAYGGEGGTYMVLIAHKSIAELDRGIAEDKQFEEAMGEDGMKQLGALIRRTEESSTRQVYEFNPRMSYVSEEWIKADPDFWKPKPVQAHAAKPAAEEKKAKP